MNRNLWVISELYYPEETSTGYLLTKIAEGLARYYSVRVLCGQPTYSARGLRSPSQETHNQVHIRRCPSTTLNKDVLLFRLINLVTLSLSIFFTALIHLKRHEYVLVVTNPPLLPFIVTLACKLRGTQCLLLIHDVYPEVLTATGMAKQESWLVGIIGWLTQWLYRGMARIIVLGRDMQALALRKLNNRHARIKIISNWADLNLIGPTSKQSNILLNQLQLADKFVIQYAGNMGRTHGLESLLASAAQLATHPQIHFLFIGSGAKKQWVDQTVTSQNLKNVTVLGNRPRSEQQDFLNACDVSIISFVSGMSGVSVPSRMYNVMAAGKPILAVADGNSELALVVQEEQIGYVIPPDNTKLLVDTILKMYAHRDCLQEMGMRARAAAETKYSLHKVLDAYITMIDDLEHER